jgi:excisionase family DNA binding protein
MPDDLLTSTEVAARLGVSDETVRRWADTRRITHIRFPSGQLRFRPEDVDAILRPVEPEAS